MTQLWKPGDRPIWPRQTVTVALVLLLSIFILPLALLPWEDPQPKESEPLPTATLPVVTPTPQAQTTPVPGWDAAQTLRFLNSDGTVEELPVSDYLWSVVAAEMPASFRPEALKAQAVAARTYAMNLKLHPSGKHPQADVCGDSACCQAYLTQDQAAGNWGADAQRYTDKITQAVSETDGLLCLYDGKPINAVFFSSAAGKTLDAAEVWGSGVPYLRSVDSPEGEEVPGWQTVMTFTAAQLKDLLSQLAPQADFSGAPDTWFTSLTQDSIGGVASLTAGGTLLTGAQLRSALGLRSTHFTLEPGEDTLTVRVTGYGHGVGMSQYGANAMAGEGKTFDQILAWYYTGVTVSGWAEG